MPKYDKPNPKKPSKKPTDQEKNQTERKRINSKNQAKRPFKAHRNTDLSDNPKKRENQHRNNNRPFDERPTNVQRSFNRPERSSDRPASQGKPVRDNHRTTSSSAPEERRFQRRSNNTFLGNDQFNSDRTFSRTEKLSPKSRQTFDKKSTSTRQNFNSSSSSTRHVTGQSKSKNIKKFNPSDFIKKVEEQVVSATYVPKHTFSDFLIDEQLKKNIIKRGYTAPTPIQDQAIPHLLQGKDIIGTANTGTGKTAAFLIPLVNNLLTKKTNRVLIITPTRELAAQIQDELKYFMAETGFTSALCIGGLSINVQIKILERNPEFVIGTPGRLKDLEKNDFLNFNRYNSIVLDEVDTMLDMGFIHDMKYIISKLPTKRHSLFFSATISPEIKTLMNQFLHNPVSISVKTRQTAENVNQTVIKVNAADKIEALHDLLIKPEFTKVIIFVRTKRSTDKLAKSLRERGFKIATIHGDKSQAQRKQALELFKGNQIKILLATDVVARGIDIDDVSHVINYDLPQTYEDYIHRIGRTGRANKIGQALTFIE